MRNNPIISICLISPVPPPIGGISRWTSLVHQYANNYKKLRFIQVNTATRWRKIDDWSIYKRIIGGGIQLFVNYISYLSALLQKPDVIHLTTSGGIGTIRDLLICLTASLFHVPIVYHIRFGRIPEIASKNNFEWRFFATVIKLVDTVIAIDKSTAEVVAMHFQKNNIRHIPNPIDFSILQNSEKNKSNQNIILFLGWVIKNKGIEELIQAWSILSPPDWTLLIAGPGDDAYKQTLMTQYMPCNVQFLKEIKHEQAMQLMSKCDVFILPSYSEGCPNTVLEAMAMGKPVIGSRVGALPEMLSEDCGVLIAPRHMEETKQAMANLIQNKDLRVKLGANARRKARQKYSIDIVFDQYINVWRNLAMR